jgi:hypothetical protein
LGKVTLEQAWRIDAGARARTACSAI